MRPSREALHMRTAQLWAKRSLCSRLRVGAVITTPDMRRVLSVGYNGPARSLPHDRCLRDQPGNCRCLHAEDNAIAFGDSTVRDAILFVTVAPCEQCAQRLINTGVSAVWWIDNYRQVDGLNLLTSAGVAVRRMVALDFVGT